MISSAYFWEPVILSIKTAGTALIIVSILGIAFARLMNTATFRGKLLVETIFLLPTVLPPTVIGFLLIFIFGNQGMIGELIYFFTNQSIMFTWSAVVIVAVVVAFPFMYQSVKTGLSNIDPEIEMAARNAGANELQIFLYISLPLCIKSIIAGIILSFSRALGEFGATFMFAGNLPGRTQTIPIAIFTALETGNTHLAWAWVIVIITLSFSMLLLIRRFSV